MTTPAGMWLRVSSGKQDEASQIPDNMAWIRSRGYDLAATYTIHGRSAYKGNRGFDAAWQHVLADMASGKIRVLVVWKQDRIDRKLHTFQMLEQVVDAGGRVEFVTQPHLNDLTTMGGRISLKVQEEIAYAESKDKSDRVKASHAVLRDAGKLIGRPSFGLVSTGERYDRTLAPTGQGRKYVMGTEEEPGIFLRVIAGDSLAVIAKWLDEQGVKPVSGKRWWPRTLADLIRNPVYAGRREQWETREDGTRVLHVHRCEPLVDSVTFRRANEALDSRPKRGPQVAENRAMLAESLTCPACSWTVAERMPSSPMYRIKSFGEAFYYRCSGRGSQRRGCGNMVPLAAVDDLVNRFMQNFDAPVMTERLIPGHNHETELEDVKVEMRALASRDLADDEYDAELARLRSERDRLTGLPKVDDHVEYVATGQTYAEEWESLDQAERGAWLRAKGIRVYPSKSAELCETVFPGPLAAFMAGAHVADYGTGVSAVITIAGSGLYAAAELED